MKSIIFLIKLKCSVLVMIISGISQFGTDIGDYHIIAKEDSISSQSLTSHLWPFLRSEVVKYFSSPTLEIEGNHYSSVIVVAVPKYFVDGNTQIFTF